MFEMTKNEEEEFNLKLFAKLIKNEENNEENNEEDLKTFIYTFHSFCTVNSILQFLINTFIEESSLRERFENHFFCYLTYFFYLNRERINLIINK